MGIKEIEDNYEQVWKTCRDDNAVTQVSPLKLNVFSSINDAGLFAWDCETYSESEKRKAIPYACTLINLEKLRKMLYGINNLFPDLNPTDNVPENFMIKHPEEFYLYLYLIHSHMKIYRKNGKDRKK